jgi:hypothetical protein
MKYWYEVVTFEFVDIDFQEIYDFIRKEEPQFTDLCDIYLEFIDNIGYYIRSIYANTEDLDDEYNEHFFKEVQKGWEEFLEEEFGYKE